MLKKISVLIGLLVFALTGSIESLDSAQATPSFPSDAMVLEYQIPDSVSDSERTVGLALTGSVNVTVDWGDGSISVVATSGTAEHTYSSPAGTFYIQITGTLSNFGTWNPEDVHNSNKYLTKVLQFGTLTGLTNLANAFAKAPLLTQVPSTLPVGITDLSYAFMDATNFDQNLSGWDTQNVTKMDFMFYGAINFNSPLSPSVGGWNTSNLVSTQSMFEGATKFNQPIGAWDMSKVTSLRDMFYRASAFNQSLDSWNVSNVLSLSNTFAAAESFNQPLSSWDVSSVTDFRGAFSNASSFNQNLNSWNTSSAIIMDGVFCGAKVFNQPLSNWDVSHLTSLQAMFCYTDAFNQDLSSWNVSNVTNMVEMFNFAKAFNNNSLANWDVSNVTNFASMFANADLFNGDITNWNTSSATRMDYMLYANFAFNQPISDWNVSQVTTMAGMLSYNLDFNQDLHLWNVGRVQEFTDMFSGASSFNQPLGSWDTSSATSMQSMFSSALLFNQDISSWNVSNVTDMSNMFRSATSFNMPLSSPGAGWDTSNVTDMSYMFADATSFNQQVSSLNVSNVIDMSFMFKGAAAFNLPIVASPGNWETSMVSDMSHMFESASSFNQPIESWDVSSVTTMAYMFYGAVAFDMDLSQWDTSNVTDMSHIFDGSGLWPAHYSEFLRSLAASPTRQSNVTLSGGPAFLCSASLARDTLIYNLNWSVNDGGPFPCFTPQTINFYELDPIAHNNNLPINKSVTLSATATSGLPVFFRWISGPCVVSSGNLSALPGSLGKTCVISALQHDLDPYSDAVQVLHTVTISGAVQSHFNVTYLSNGANSGSVTDATNYTSGAEVTVMGKGNLIRTGYSFSGWNTQANGQGTPYEAGDTFIVTDGNVTNVPLYAQWTPKTSTINFSGPSMSRAVTATLVGLAAKVTWLAPENGRPISSYVVNSVPNGLQCLLSILEAKCTGLKSGVTYRFRVTAINSDGTSISELSNAVTYTNAKLTSKTISGFDAGRYVLKEGFKKQIKAFVATKRGASIFVCTGYTTTEPRLMTDRQLGLSRARAVCGYIKRLLPESLVSLKAARPANTYGPGNRKVVISVVPVQG